RKDTAAQCICAAGVQRRSQVDRASDEMCSAGLVKGADAEISDPLSSEYGQASRSKVVCSDAGWCSEPDTAVTDQKRRGQPRAANGHAAANLVHGAAAKRADVERASAVAVYGDGSRSAKRVHTRAVERVADAEEGAEGVRPCTLRVNALATRAESDSFTKAA